MLVGFTIEIGSKAIVPLGIALAQRHFLFLSCRSYLLAEGGDEYGMKVQERDSDLLMHLLRHEQGSLLQGRAQRRPHLLGDLCDCQ